MHHTASVTTALALATILIGTAPMALAADLVVQPVLVEVHPNPDGVDRGNEWFELYNPAPVDLVLDGWSVNDPDACNDGVGYALDGLSVPAGGYLVVTLSDTCMNMRNSHDALTLVAPSGQAIQTVSWGPEGDVVAPGSGVSVASCPTEAGVYANWTLAAATPGTANPDCGQSI